MEFLARVPPPAQEKPIVTSPTLTHASVARTPQQTSRDLSDTIHTFSPGFTSAAQESYVRGSPKAVPTPVTSGDANVNYTPILQDANAGDNDLFAYMPQTQTQTSPSAEGRWEGRHGEMGQMDAEWMLSLCEGDGFSLQMLNEMIRFEPSLGA